MASRPAWQNEAMRQQRAFEAWLNRAEIKLATKVAKSKNKMIAEIARLYPLAPDMRFLLPLSVHQQELESILRVAYGQAINYSGRATVSQIEKLKPAKAIGKWPEFFALLLQQWAGENALANATTIAQTTMNDVRAAINNGLAAGQGVAAVAAEIGRVAILTPWRARTVARTELHNAASFAQSETARQASESTGLKLLKFWRPTLDGRTRDAHAAMSRHPGIELDQKFNVGGVMMMRPGDSAGGASNVCNCRCTLTYRPFEITME